MNNLLQLLERLHKHEVEFVLVGGLAATAYGSTLVTQDVDVCCPFEFPNMFRLQKSLEDLHPVYRMTNDIPMAITEELCSRLKNLYLVTDLGPLDCLGEVMGLGAYAEVKKHSRVATMSFGKILILDPESLIISKEAMGRPKDIEAVRQLKALRTKLN